MQAELILRIILENPASEVVYGIQKGGGSNYETLQKQKAKSGNLCFEFGVQVKFNEKNEPIFLGPFTQGPPKERFVYIDIGTCAGQMNTPWSRRLKIPLKGISGNLLRNFSPEDILVTKVQGSGGKDGGPTCGTVKPLNSWEIISKESD